MTKSRLILWMLVGVAAAWGCGGSKSDEPPVSTVKQPSPDEAADEAGDEPPKRVALTPKQLSPILHHIGPADAVPTAIAIEFGAAIIDAGQAGEAASKTVVKITPDTPVRVTYASTSGLRVVPNAPLAFDTKYEIELVKVETRDGVIEPPKGEQWKHSFQTPPFKLIGWAPTRVDTVGKVVIMEASFSGAVLPNKTLAALEILIDGRAPAGIASPQSSDATRVAIQITDPKLGLGSKLSMRVKSRLAAVADGAIASGRAEYTVAAAKAVAVKAADVVEGSSGFYVEVVCNDEAAPAGHRSAYRAGRSFYELSERCQLTEESASKIHFDPPVKGVYVTGGRAGFRVFGQFKRGAYAMKLDAGAMSVDGGTVIAPFTQSFVVSARKPQIAFGSSGRYLPRAAWNNLAIRHLNVDAVNLVVRQIPQENLVFWLGGPDAADERTSNVILKKEIPLRGAPDELKTTWIDAAALLPATTKGILELKVIGLGTRTTSRLMLTNMSLVAKKATTPNKPWDQQVQVWALGMDSSNLLDGVDVSLVRRSGKVVAKCTTSGAKGCLLETKPSTDPDRGEPFAVIAKKGDDLTYIRYEDLRATVAESNTSGLPYAMPDTPYRAAVYADRGVYRPGDTAHVVAIVRDAKERAPDKALPVEVQIVDPRSKVARKMTLSTNGSGVIAFDHALPAFADTGHWRVQLAVADKPLASHSLQVEEFMPERMRVTATAKTPNVLIGEPVSFGVDAQYLFGGSATDSGVELSCSAEPTRFAPKENADLTYGVEPKGKAVQMGMKRDQIDMKGTATVACPPAAPGSTFTQTAELTGTISVLEAGSGRATVRSASATVHPERFYVGIRSKATRAAPGEAFTVEGMLVDWNGKPMPQAAAKVQIELAHLEADYGYGYDEESGEATYDRHTRTVPEGKQEAVVQNGKFSFTVTPGAVQAGYVVRVIAGKAKTELVLEGDYSYEYYGYGDGDRADQTPRPSRPTQLALDLPKQIKVGESIAVKVKTPYRGKLLWTVETDKIVTSEWKDVSGAEATWSFKLGAFAPNVYVSAFLIKDPHLESKDAFLPDRAFGISSSRVTPAEFTQELKIDAPKEVRSSSPLTVSIDVGAGAGPTVVTVAVVDEGILSLTNFQTPDPLAQLFAKRALGVETYETIGWTMLHKPAGASAQTGGGDDDGGPLGQGRIQPVKPVALFSGVVTVGADGKAKIPFTVPQYRGQLRVMAITASATKVGRAEAKITVRDPLVVQTTFPRFLTQGDEIQIPVFMTNVSGGPLDVSVALQVESVAIAGLAAPKGGAAPLAFPGKTTGALKLDDGRNDTLVFRATAGIPVGGAKLRVVATAKGRAGAFTVTDEVEVPFLPAGPKERKIAKIRLEAGKLDLAAQAALKGWSPTSEKTTFWMTTNPYGEAFDHLRHVVHYPYGCIEQTTSATRPLLYLAEMVEQIDPELTQGKLEDMVLAGINRVLSMETPSGGLGYWPGSTEPEEWGTAYAVHMLLDAKRAGYAVPDDRLAGLLKWIEQRVSMRENGTRVRTNRWGNYDEQAEAYLHYVLAVAGKGRKARIQTLIAGIPANAKGELVEGRYMLKAALYLAGDRRYEKDLKTVDASPILDDRSNGWSFYSDRRRRGFMLATFFDLFGNDRAGEALAERVASGLIGQPSYYYNTQEIVWGVTGLGKWVKGLQKGGANAGAAAGTLIADGVAIDARKTKAQSPDRAWSVARASEYRTLVLDVPAASAGKWLVINSEGVRPGADYRVGGNGLSVSRVYRKLDGTEIDLAAGDLKLGDLVFVEVTVENTSGAPIQNIALVDRLPAGFEIENPRLGRSTKVDWAEADQQWPTDYLTMRDDRINAFGALAPKTSKQVIYTVRAVTSGKFTVPPVEAEAMYDPALWARAKGGTAVVGGPWTGKTI